MLYYSALFFIVAVVAGIFGFGGVAAASAGIAQFLFFLFIAAFIISIVLHIARKIDSKTNL